jgi:hypothetical protein
MKFNRQRREDLILTVVKVVNAIIDLKSQKMTEKAGYKADIFRKRAARLLMIQEEPQLRRSYSTRIVTI